MADTITSQTIADTSGLKFTVKLTNFSDGTGETLVNKVDASELTFMLLSFNEADIKLHSLFVLHKMAISLKLKPCFCLCLIIPNTFSDDLSS